MNLEKMFSKTVKLMLALSIGSLASILLSPIFVSKGSSVYFIFISTPLTQSIINGAIAILFFLSTGAMTLGFLNRKSERYWGWLSMTRSAFLALVGIALLDIVRNVNNIEELIFCSILGLVIGIVVVLFSGSGRRNNKRPSA